MADDVYDTWREASFSGNGGHEKVRAGGGLGGFDDDGVAAGDGEEDGTEEEDDGGVPRDDFEDHSVWLFRNIRRPSYNPVSRCPQNHQKIHLPSLDSSWILPLIATTVPAICSSRSRPTLTLISPQNDVELVSRLMHSASSACLASRILLKLWMSSRRFVYFVRLHAGKAADAALVTLSTSSREAAEAFQRRLLSAGLLTGKVLEEVISTLSMNKGITYAGSDFIFDDEVWYLEFGIWYGMD